MKRHGNTLFRVSSSYICTDLPIADSGTNHPFLPQTYHRYPVRRHRIFVKKNRHYAQLSSN